jgi:hypothetical protein
MKKQEQPLFATMAEAQVYYADQLSALAAKEGVTVRKMIEAADRDALRTNHSKLVLELARHEYFARNKVYRRGRI